MAESKSHKATANRIAKKFNAEYNSGKGADIKSSFATIEIETENTVKGSLTQLQGHKGPVYVAGANQKTVEAILEKTDGTTVGVMDKDGNIIKPSTRRV